MDASATAGYSPNVSTPTTPQAESQQQQEQQQLPQMEAGVCVYKREIRGGKWWIAGLNDGRTEEGLARSLKCPQILLLGTTQHFIPIHPSILQRKHSNNVLNCIFLNCICSILIHIPLPSLHSTPPPLHFIILGSPRQVYWENSRWSHYSHWIRRQTQLAHSQLGGSQESRTPLFAGIRPGRCKVVICDNTCILLSCYQLIAFSP